MPSRDTEERFGRGVAQRGALDAMRRFVHVVDARTIFEAFVGARPRRNVRFTVCRVEGSVRLCARQYGKPANYPFSPLRRIKRFGLTGRELKLKLRARRDGCYRALPQDL